MIEVDPGLAEHAAALVLGVDGVVVATWVRGFRAAATAEGLATLPDGVT